MTLRAPLGGRVLAERSRPNPWGPFHFEVPAGRYLIETASVAGGLFFCDVGSERMWPSHGSASEAVELRAGECTALTLTPWIAGRLRATLPLPERTASPPGGEDGWLPISVEVVDGPDGPRELHAVPAEPDLREAR